MEALRRIFDEYCSARDNEISESQLRNFALRVYGHALLLSGPTINSPKDGDVADVEGDEITVTATPSDPNNHLWAKAIPDGTTIPNPGNDPSSIGAVELVGGMGQVPASGAVKYASLPKQTLVVWEYECDGAMPPNCTLIGQKSVEFYGHERTP